MGRKQREDKLRPLGGTDVDLYSFQGAQEAGAPLQIVNHIEKRHRREKGLEITFDPAAHKEYVTGFRKRKQLRRKDALVDLAKRARKQALEDRAEKREKRLAQLGVKKEDLDDERSSDGDASDGEAPGASRPEPAVPEGGEQMTYRVGSQVANVSIQPIRNEDSSDEDGEDEGEDAGEGEGAGGARGGARGRAGEGGGYGTSMGFKYQEEKLLRQIRSGALKKMPGAGGGKPRRGGHGAKKGGRGAKRKGHRGK
ncbi:unnamed protein product [Pedinophyceae sp. YPF-701]|nr:unnamed protein product [Pedinophyceae sp. YPF-701]